MQARLCRFDGYVAHYMKSSYIVLGCAIAVWQNTCMLAVLLFKWAYIWVPGKLILTIPRLIHLKAFTELFYFSYTSHKPCSVLLFVIPVKKEKNLRWLKVQEKSKFRVTIFVLKERYPVNPHPPFFDLRMHRPLIDVGMWVFPSHVFISSKVFLWSQSRLSLWSCGYADT